MTNQPMIMNPEYLKYCRYYKGEETAPIGQKYDGFIRFWHLEREYYSSVYDEKHEYWETEGQRFCESPRWLKKFVDGIHDKRVRGFVAWATTMVAYNSPMDNCGFILKYEYDD